MKKYLCLLLALGMILSLCACGGVSEKKIIGRWYTDDGGSIGKDEVVIHIYEGGNCKVEYTYTLQFVGERLATLTGTWELSKDILTIHVNRATKTDTYGFKIDDSVNPYTMVDQYDNSCIYEKLD